MNNCILIGRLCADPELKFLPNSKTAVATFTLAVDKQLSKDKKQEMEANGAPTADFIKVVVWGKQAESCAQYTGKGKLLAVQGRIQTRSYEDNNKQRRYVTEVVAERTQFLQWKDDNNNSSFPKIDGFQPVDDENIPF